MTEYVRNIMNTVDKRRIRKICEKITKSEKILKKRNADGIPIGGIADLAMWLYIFGYKEEALTAVGFLGEKPCSEYFLKWNVLDGALCLKARMLREQGRTEESREIAAFVRENRNFDFHGGVNFHTVTFLWNVTCDKYANAALKNGDRVTARYWRYQKLTFAIQFREVNSSEFSDEQLEEMIAELLENLKTER